MYICVSLVVTNSYFVAENTKICHRKLFMCKKLQLYINVVLLCVCVCVCVRAHMHYSGVCMHIGVCVGGWGCVCVGGGW